MFRLTKYHGLALVVGMALAASYVFYAALDTTTKKYELQAAITNVPLPPRKPLYADQEAAKQFGDSVKFFRAIGQIPPASAKAENATTGYAYVVQGNKFVPVPHPVNRPCNSAECNHEPPPTSPLEKESSHMPG